MELSFGMYQVLVHLIGIELCMRKEEEERMKERRKENIKIFMFGFFSAFVLGISFVWGIFYNRIAKVFCF